MRIGINHIRWLKIIIWLAAGLPLTWLFIAVSQGSLSADPAKDIQHVTGLIALKLLLVTLIVSPLARYGKQPLLMRTRRLLGLWCFAWATLHLFSYATLELGLDFSLLGSELLNRPYLTLGMVSWSMLLALTITSHSWVMRKMGAHWQKLHNFVYLIAILVIFHYLWSIKTLSPLPVVYAIATTILLAFRYKKLRQWWH